MYTAAISVTMLAVLAVAHPVMVARKDHSGRWSFYERSGDATSFRKDEVRPKNDIINLFLKLI